jgi:arylsulfatase A-like enzyme
VRSAIWTSWVALGGLALAACGPPPPSILLVTLDTLRRDHVGVYADGGGFTPSLDALAAEGLVHEAAYTTMPTTGPAHLSLFTGLYPSEHGARRNGEALPSRLAQRELAARLRGNGYATAAFLTSQLMSRAATGLRGFEIYDAPSGTLRPGENAVDAALAWLRAERRRPVFLFVHLYDAHAPYGSADEKRRSFPVERGAYGWIDEPGRYATAEERRDMAERYARGVGSADAALGRLVAGARAQLEPPPFVAVVADHGETLADHLEERGYAYDHGEFLDAESVSVPLLLAGPGVEPGRSPGTASIRDLYTTLLAAAGIDDGEAAAAGRRDLRRPSATRRVVGIERRRFGGRVRDAVRSHGAAAADGARLVIVAEDGNATAAPDAAAAGLLEAARERLGRHAERLEPLDAETREALRDLGYAE